MAKKNFFIEMSKPIRHFLSLKDYTTKEVQSILKATKTLRLQAKSNSISPFLAQKTLALIFTKPSTRTRVSSEAGWALFGGHPLFLGQRDIQMGAGEPLHVTSRVVSSMCECIIARLGSHDEILELAQHSSVPVINALTAKFHPLQILADLATLEHVYGDKKLKIAWVGDSNNILNSMLVTYPRLGHHLSVATPKGYSVDRSLIGEGTTVHITNDPIEACKDADVIMTDTWVSMGEEAEAIQKKKDFAGFQVTEEMGKVANPDWKFMHCLPRKPFEVDDEVFAGDRSLIYEQAEFRKYSVMAVYQMLLY